MLLPQTGLYAALDVAERMRKVIAEALPSPESGMPVPVSVSIGVSTMRSSDDTIDALLNRADRALYQAKNSGRNQVRFATNE
ncbi:GGDEF domain-containing protein [Paludibacterium denitrificans]|uniref:GGDEF domain-containing protein n=1 Tax=Paludibacterium denitrificans TaxID=2675226 RepID=UPI0028AC2BBB|nr:GGDEF domain-containing protein [Paludibacterium denitrificans]